MLVFVRYVLPGALFAVGVALLILADESVRYEGFGLCFGAAFALAVFAQLIRLNTGDADDRDREAAAREYFTQHGRWPDEDG
jgi:drug/metabolite transporter (DMT)-like permease